MNENNDTRKTKKSSTPYHGARNTFTIEHGKAIFSHKLVRKERTFSTSSKTWRELRKVILARDPVCVICHSVPANEVDHIDDDPTNNSVDNLQGLCKPCHSKKTILGSGVIKSKEKALNNVKKKQSILTPSGKLFFGKINDDI